MTLAALLAAALLAAPAKAGDCEALARHGRLNRAARAVPRPWAKLKSAFLEALASQPDNAAAKRAADTLRDSTLGLSEAPVEDAVGAPAGAEFDPETRLIVLDARDLSPLWAAEGTRREKRELRRTAARLAPVLVHELAHVRLRDRLGPLPPFAEEELLADGEETLYLLGALQSDPDALGLRAFDERVEPPTPARRRAGWWKTAAPESAELAADEAESSSDDPWLAERWRLVRGMGAGYDSFQKVLRDGGVLEGPSALAFTELDRRRALADARRLRAAHERCLAQASADDRADHEAWSRRLSDEELAYQDTARLTKLAEGFRAEMAGQRRDLERLRSSSGR